MQEPNSQNSNMKRFSDFAEEPQALEGDKISIDSILNQELVVSGYRIGKTKYSSGGSEKCLTLEVIIDGEKRVVFTGSCVLMDQIEKYSCHLPFVAEIIKIKKYYRFK